MEKTADAVVVPLDAGWNDVGSWSALLEVSPQDAQGNAHHGDVIEIDCRNTYAYGSRLIAMVGLQDVVVKEGLISTLIMLGHKLKTAPITVEKDLAPDLPTVPGHPAELNQVWTNLIDNAVQAMPDGGTLRIRTALEDDCVLVEIGDTGSGIPDELKDRIFEPFFTTKPVGEGTGLGLDICYRVITQRHGGDLRVVSVPGDTRFQVRLPLRRATDGD
jgi:signal transduction histidine kinase